jgi:ATP-dependent protease ClpP protease subunit
MAARSTLTPKGMKEMLKDEQKEWRLTPREALKLGFIDKIGMPSIRKYSVIEYE